MKLINFASVFLLLLLPLFCFAEEQSSKYLWSDIDLFNNSYTEDLSELKERRIIRALVVYSKTGFFVHKGSIRGLEVEYLKQYEKLLNKGIKKEAEKIHIVYIPVSFDQLIPSLLAGKGDIAAAMLTITEERQKQVSFATGGERKVNELIVTHKNSLTLNSLEDLAGKTIYVEKGSSYVEHLKSLNQELVAKKLPAIIIREAAEYLTSEDILEMVNAGVITITVVDDFEARQWAKVLPDIMVREDLVVNEGGMIGWAVRKDNPELQQDLNKAAQTIKQGTKLGNALFNRFYKNTRWIKHPGIASERQKFGRFVHLFKKYGKKYNFDHLALIAQAYHESGLNQKAVSHMGAIGIMQILPSTARDPAINIPKIEKLEDNIHAGSKYLNHLRKYYFSDPAISKFDQMVFSWAAYNAGPGNVRKMRRLTEKMGLDKNLWFKNVEIACGRIIGTETVRYVANIYKYYQAYLLMDEIDSRKQDLKSNTKTAIQ